MIHLRCKPSQQKCLRVAPSKSGVVIIFALLHTAHKQDCCSTVGRLQKEDVKSKAFVHLEFVRIVLLFPNKAGIEEYWRDNGNIDLTHFNKSRHPWSTKIQSRTLVSCEITLLDDLNNDNCTKDDESHLKAELQVILPFLTFVVVGYYDG